MAYFVLLIIAVLPLPFAVIFLKLRRSARLYRNPSIEPVNLSTVSSVDQATLADLTRAFEELGFQQAGDFSFRVVDKAVEYTRLFLDGTNTIRAGVAWVTDREMVVRRIALTSVLHDDARVQSRNDNQLVYPEPGLQVFNHPDCGVGELYRLHQSHLDGEIPEKQSGNLRDLIVEEIAERTSRMVESGVLKADRSGGFYSIPFRERLRLSLRVWLSIFGFGHSKAGKKEKGKRTLLFVSLALFIVAADMLLLPQNSGAVRVKLALLTVGSIVLIAAISFSSRPRPGQKSLFRRILLAGAATFLILFNCYIGLFPGTAPYIGVLFGKNPAVTGSREPAFKSVTSDSPHTLEASLTLEAPLMLEPIDLDNMLYLYTVFFAVGHDQWLASEASMVETSITVSEMPAGLDAEGQLALFPAILQRLNGSKGLFCRLKGPETESYQQGVYCDPDGRKIVLVGGAQYTQDGYGGFARYLEGRGTGKLRVVMHFMPGDYGDQGDLERYALVLSGRLNEGRIFIDAIGGRMSTRKQAETLLAAARQFRGYDNWKGGRYELRNEKEAREVEKLAGREFGTDYDEATRQGNAFIVKERAFDLELFILYVQYGQIVLEPGR